MWIGVRIRGRPNNSGSSESGLRSSASMATSTPRPLVYAMIALTGSCSRGIARTKKKASARYDTIAQAVRADVSLEKTPAGHGDVDDSQRRAVPGEQLAVEPGPRSGVHCVCS